MFVAIFVSLIGWLVYFNLVKSEEFINSPYNTRQDTFADRVIRGSILSAEGETLAASQIAEDGSEYRYYPYANMFAHVVGYADYGKSGLESEANFHLLSSHAFFLEQMKNEFKNEKNKGDNVVTTLSVKLQTAAYNALGDRKGAVVVLEPSTGKILSMVSRSDFDPNYLKDNWDYLTTDEENSSLLNRATQGQYPPGSVFKIVTALDYLRKHGTVDGFNYTCQGEITKQEHTITDYDRTVHGQEDLRSAFAYSCNSAFAEMGVQMGGKSLREAGESLLFNKKLPLTMDYKSSVLSVDGKSGVPLMMQTSIGQGNTLVSPMHMAMVASTIANRGVLMKPYLIDRVENYNGDRVKKYMPDAYRELLPVSEASVLAELMEGVVEYGTATSLGGQGYTVAGKTGSAEYGEGEIKDSHSWFVGYSNVEDPDIAVSVIIEGGGTGSESAVPVAGAIFNAYYYQ
ncbi:MAG: penicillin-binding protein 2 [Lachnospiraceae bacterium]|nr:penicillin-binding protein 2 [Lachnospiraceae bacterium]